MSIPKAVALLGIGHDYLRLIPCDDDFRIRTDVLRDEIPRDVEAGLTPLAIVGRPARWPRAASIPCAIWPTLPTNSVCGFTLMAPMARWLRSQSRRSLPE